MQTSLFRKQEAKNDLMNVLVQALCTGPQNTFNFCSINSESRALFQNCVSCILVFVKNMKQISKTFCIPFFKPIANKNRLYVCELWENDPQILNSVPLRHFPTLLSFSNTSLEIEAHIPLSVLSHRPQKRNLLFEVRCLLPFDLKHFFVQVTYVIRFSNKINSLTFQLYHHHSKLNHPFCLVNADWRFFVPHVLNTITIILRLHKPRVKTSSSIHLIFLKSFFCPMSQKQIVFPKK